MIEKENARSRERYREKLAELNASVATRGGSSAKEEFLQKRRYLLACICVRDKISLKESYFLFILTKKLVKEVGCKNKFFMYLNVM